MANFINYKKQQMSSVSPFFKELGQKEAAKLQGWLTLKASLDFLPGLSFVPQFVPTLHCLILELATLHLLHFHLAADAK